VGLLVLVRCPVIGLGRPSAIGRWGAGSGWGMRRSPGRAGLSYLLSGGGRPSLGLGEDL
jgi:hypothetical protein